MSRALPARCAGSAALLLAALVAAPAPAQPPAPDAQEEVIVVGRRLEESIPLDLEQFGNRVEIITADQLELGGFDDIGQTLQMQVPGLYLAPKNGAFDYMDCSLHGSRCQDILWLIDGVRINNRLYNTTAPLDTVPAHLVERIEVLYGGQGIFYGTQSVAGVVNIVTKAFRDEPGGSLGVGFDGNGGIHASADFSTSIGGHRIVLYASKDEADGFQPFRDDAFQPSGTDRDRGYDVATAGVKYGYAFNDASQLTLHLQHSDAEVEFAAPARQRRAFNARDEDILTAKWDYTLGENVDLFLKGYYHWWDSHYTQIDNELDEAGRLTGNAIVVSDAEFWGYDDYGVTAMARIRSQSGLEYAVGYDRQQFSGRDDVLLIGDRTEHVNALFGQIRTGEGLLENTRLAVGLRHNRPSGAGDVTVGNLSGKHDFSDRLYVRGSLGTSFRLPDAFQLYGNDPCCTLGNPDLEGEKSRNLDVAVGGGAGSARLGWELVVFTREVEHLIGPVNGVFANTRNTVDFDGWEAHLSAPLTDALTATFSYTDTEARERGAREQVTGIPERTFKATLSYRPPAAPYEIGASLVDVGDVFDSVGGDIGRVEHGGYTVVDLAASYRFGGDERQRVGLRIENALDEEYASSVGLAFRDADGMPYAYWNLGTPRTAHLTYEYRF